MMGMIADMMGRLAPARSSRPALAGLVVPLAVVFTQESGLVAGRLVLLLLVITGWQLAFRRLRGQAFGGEGLVSAILLALLTPPDAPLWQQVFAASFGIVIGELVFGGRGRNFLHPVVVALTFLMFSFTGEGYRAGPQIPVWTLAPALVLLLASGQAMWRVVAGLLAGLLLAGWAMGLAQPWLPLASGAVCVALLFLAADPVASAATNAGRLAFGLLAGVLATVFGQAGEAFGGTVFAILLASIFAPLIDHCVIAIHIRLRERRHERA